MKYLLTLLLLLPYTCTGQETLLTKTFQFREGIYTCFGELVRNSPRYLKCRLDMVQPPAGYPKVYYIDSTGRRQVFHDSCFCVVSDGKLLVRDGFQFRACLMLGAVTLLQETAIPSGQFKDYAALETNYWLLDFETGDFLPYNRKNADHILGRDEDLYGEFRVAKRNGSFAVMMSYLLKYNERHPFYLKNP